MSWWNISGGHSAIHKYYLYRAASASGFISPYLIVFLVGRSISFTDIALGGSVLAIVTFLSEVPTGLVGDKVGRRASLLAGQVLSAAATTGWIFVRARWSVVAVFFVFGLSVALKSGSQSAWLYDSLEADEDSDRFTEIESRASSLAQWTTVVTMIIGGLLFLVNPVVPFAGAALFNWVAVVVVYSFPKNVRYEDDDSEETSARRILGVVRTFLTNSAVRSVVVLNALFMGVFSAGSDYIQPIVVGSLPPLELSVLGIVVTEKIALGWIYAGFTSISAVAVNYADDLETTLGTGPAILACYGLAGIAMLGPLTSPVLAIPAVVAFMSIPSVVGPIRGNYLNTHSGSAERATVLSSVSLLGMALRIPFLLTGGVVADRISPTVAFGVLGGIFLLVGSVAVLADLPFTKPASDDRQPTDSPEPN